MAENVSHPIQPPMNPVNQGKPPSMATVTIIIPTDDTDMVFDTIKRIRSEVSAIPGVMLDVRYRTTP